MTAAHRLHAGFRPEDLGLALDPSEDAPALAAERKAQTASLEEDAVNKAKAAGAAGAASLCCKRSVRSL